MPSSLRLATHRQELAAHASLRPAPASTPLPSYFPLPPLTDFDVPLRMKPRRLSITVKHRGEVIVIDHVPAEVCSVCGDVLLAPETVDRIEPEFAS